MLIKLPENIENLYFCGDIHGNLDYLKYFIKTGVGFSQKISNSCIVLCGDDTLLEELLEERNYLQTCYEEMSKKGLVEDWYYGHYHSTMDTTVDNTRFHLLGINYLSRYCYNDYN